MLYVYSFLQYTFKRTTPPKPHWLTRFIIFLLYNDFSILNRAYYSAIPCHISEAASMTYTFQVPSFWPFNSNLEFDSADFKHGLYLDSWGEITFFRFRQKIKNELWLVIRYLISHVSSVILSGHFSVLEENERERSETKLTVRSGNNFPASDNNYQQFSVK